jgi:Fe-S-cluster containining protein
MSCRQGCTQCCHVDLSVFSVEADFIRQWWNQLSESERKLRREQWAMAQAKGKNLLDQIVSPCRFLIEGGCSIYEARPVICRSHGLPLKRLEGEREEVDICPLNFTDELPEKKDWLDLDRVNTLLSLLQHQHPNSDERISLAQLRTELANSRD